MQASGLAGGCARVLALALWVAAQSGCAGTPPAAGAPAEDAAAAPTPASPDELDQRIAELEQAIGRDRARLRELVSEHGDPQSGAPLHARPELREIARRLPGLQQEVGRLRRERAASGGAPAPGGP